MSRPLPSGASRVATGAQKFYVAFAAAVATVGTVVATADLTTVEGVDAAAVALLGAFGVYAVPNTVE